jgi:hypothetical protein
LEGLSPRSLEQPTLDYILALERELPNRYKDDDERISNNRRVRLMQNAVKLPKKFRWVDIEVRDPTLNDEAQRVHAALTINDPRLTVTPSSPDEEETVAATRREKFHQFMMLEAGRRIPGQDTYSDSVDALANDGGTMTKFLFESELWDERYSIKLKDDFTDEEKKKYESDTEAAKKRAGTPFIWLNCDMRYTYPVLRAGRIKEVLEIHERPASSVFRQYRLARNVKGDIVPDELGQPIPETQRHKLERTVRVLEFWDEKWVAYVVSGTNYSGKRTSHLADVKEHKHGRPPYFHAVGLKPNFMRNVKVGFSIGENKRWLVEYRSFLWTLHANVAARDAMPVMFRRLPPGAAPIVGKDGKDVRSERYNPGEIYNGRPGEELIPIQMPSVSGALKEQISIISEMIDRMTAPRIRSEIGSGPELSGFAMAEMMTESKIKYEPIVDAMTRMMLEITQHAEYLIEHVVRETVYVWASYKTKTGVRSGYLSLGPGSFKTPATMRWWVDVERANAKMVEARYWHERLQNGTAWEDQAIEAMGDNPDEVLIGRAIMRIRKSEEYVAMQDKFVWQYVGQGDVIKRALQIAQTGGQVQSGPGYQQGGPATGVPNMENLAISPAASGVTPATMQQEMARGGGNLPPGPVYGQGPGVTSTGAAGIAALQRLGPANG